MKNLIIISLDCVRRESIGCFKIIFDSIFHRTIAPFNFYGSGILSFILKPLVNPFLRHFIKPYTPNIDRIAHDGIIFTEAFTQAPFTPAAHASLFTGMNPYKHGITRMCGLKLNKNVTTLAQELKKNGYLTAGFLGSNALGKEYGLDRGFDIFDFSPETLTTRMGNYEIYRRKCDKVTDNALEWLRKTKDNKFFLFLHYFDAHEENTNISYQPFWQIIKVKEIDMQIGRILEFLDRDNLYHDSIIVITSDHGNSFGQHNEETHREYLFDTTLRIPMIIKLNKRLNNQTTSLPIRIIDIFPTVMRALEFDISHLKDFDGVDIIGNIKSQTKYDPLIYADTCIEKSISDINKLKSRYVCIRTCEWKLILETISKEIKLFNLKNDPKELHNVYKDYPMIVEKFYSSLLSMLSLDKELNFEQMNPEELSEIKKSLKSLGYL